MKTPILKNGLWGIMAVLLLILAAGLAYSTEGGVVQTYQNATTPVDDEKRSMLPCRFPSLPFW